MPAVICPVDFRIACRPLNSGESGLLIDELAALLAPFLTQDLQDTYDAAPTEPQILLDTVPNPVVVQAAVAGEVFGVHDVAGNEILQVTANPDQVNAEAGVTITDAFLNAGAVNSLVLSDTFTTGGGFVGGGILSNGTVTYDSSFFIWALLQESKVYRASAAPGFAAFTLFNALAQIENQTDVDLVQALTLNIGVRHTRRTAGTSVTASNSGMNFSPSISATIAGATMTRTTATAVIVSPTFNTVAGSIVNLGTMRGILFNAPTVAIFGSQAGVENMTAYYGIDFPNMTFGGASRVISVVRSQLNAATNVRFIDHTGSAASRMRGNLLFDVDGFGVFFGASNDASLAWNVGGWLQTTFVSTVDHIRQSSPSADRFLWTTNGGNTVSEFNFDCARFSLGAQTSAVGNQVGVFVTPARSIAVGGDWADFLLTQGGNLTVGGLAMGRVAAWVINSISYASSSGSVMNADTLTVGGFPTSSPGVTITNRQSLFVIGGRSRHAAAMQYDPISPAALASGNNNDWAGLLTGSANNGMRHWARILGDAVTSVITGIDATAVQDGDSFELTNVSANTINITDQDAASAAANRIITGTGATYVLAADETVIVRYDVTTARWRLLSGTGA